MGLHMKHWNIAANLFLKARVWVFVCVFFPVCLQGSHVKSPPIILSLSTEEGENVNKFDLIINKQKLYAFNINFHFIENDQEDRARVRKLTGSYEKNVSGVLLTPGASMIVNLRIEKVEPTENVVIFNKKINTHEIAISSWGANSFTKELAAHTLSEGRHRVIIELIQLSPELEKSSISFSITFAYRGK
jgi:hypothetical protein